MIDLLAGQRDSIASEAVLYFSAMGNELDLQCIRDGRWKLRISQFTANTYVLGSPPGQTLLLAQPELYDVDDDPQESYDSASDYPDVVERLQEKIRQSIPTFPEKVIQAYSELTKHPDSPTTPEAAAARPASYVPGPYHYDGDPK